MKKIAVIITTPPYGHERAREAVDAVLALSAYSDAIAVFFIGDGIYQILQHQNAQAFGLKQHTSMFKLFELYDLEERYVLDTDLLEREITPADLFIDVDLLSQNDWYRHLNECDIKLTF